MPTEEEIAAQAAAQKAADDEAAAKEAAESKELGLGDKGKQALKAEREARQAAEKAAKDAATELETLRKEKADAAKAKAAADEADAAKRGEFEQLATKFKSDADTLKAERDAQAEELKAIWDARNARMDAEIKTFPKDLPDFKYYPGDAASPKDRWAWFEKAAPNGFEAKKVEDAKNGFKQPKTPKPDSTATGREASDAARKAQERHILSTF